MKCPWDPVAYLAWRRGPDWYALRSECLARDAYACVKCGERVGLQAHHTRYRARPELTRLEDLQTRCGKHHEQFHERQKAADTRSLKSAERLAAACQDRRSDRRLARASWWRNQR